MGLAVAAVTVLIISHCQPIKCVSTLPDTATSSHVYGNVSLPLQLNEQYLQVIHQLLKHLTTRPFHYLAI